MPVFSQFPWPKDRLFLLGAGILILSFLLPEPLRSFAASLALALWVIGAVLAVDQEIRRRSEEQEEQEEQEGEKGIRER